MRDRAGFEIGEPGGRGVGQQVGGKAGWVIGVNTPAADSGRRRLPTRHRGARGALASGPAWSWLVHGVLGALSGSAASQAVPSRACLTAASRRR